MGVKIELSRDEFVNKLIFQKVYRKQIKFTQVFDQNDIKRNTFYVSNAFDPLPLTVITRNNNTVNSSDLDVSAVSVLKQDEVILVGSEGEHYIVGIRDFFREYDVHEGVATPRKDVFISIALLTPEFLKKHFDDPNTVIDFGSVKFTSGDYIARNCDGGLYKIQNDTLARMYVFPKQEKTSTHTKKKSPKNKS